MDYDVAVHNSRVFADSGVVPDNITTDKYVKLLKQNNLWDSCVFFAVPSLGVDKDANQYVSKVYDLKANADLVQATGTAQPKYQSNGSLLYDDGDVMESGSLTTSNPIRTAIQSLTVIFWTKIVIKTTGQLLFNRYDSTAGTLPFLIGTDATLLTNLKLHIRNGSLNKHYVSNKVIADEEWHHVTMTFENNTLRGYVDAVEGTYTKILDNTMPSLLNSVNPVKLGNVIGNGLNGTQTALHQIYNSTFTAEQILWNYNNIRPEGV